MKLTMTPPIVTHDSSTVSHTPKSREEGGFNRVLAETLEGQSSRPEGPVHSVGSLNAAVGIGPEWIGRNTIESDFEQLIGGLDVYREKLGNPACTLKDIEPDLQTVNALRKRLADRLETLPENDPIKGILNEGLIVASTEIERFYRGEYC